MIYFYFKKIFFKLMKGIVLTKIIASESKNRLKYLHT